MESPNDLLGTYGSPVSPLYKDRTYIETDSASDGGGSDLDDSVATDNFDNGTPDTLSYDIGGGPVVSQIDSLALVTGTITFNDGTTLTDQFAVMQDDTGAVFLMISDDQTALDDKGVVSFQITSVDGDGYSGLNQFTRDDLNFVACFTNDARILTPTGMTSIRKLAVGDMVMTRDHGPQPIRWIGETKIRKKDLLEKPNLQPYRIKADCFGPGMPFRDLTLSPQHRVLTGGKIVREMFGQDEMLIAVKHLEKVKKVQKPKVKGNVIYRHILFDRHEVIYANGLPTESMLIGQEARRKLPRALVAEIEALMPQIALSPAAYPPARVLGRGHQGRLLTERLRRRRAHGRSYDATVIAAR
ncbi:Hint domain-containing protein [Pseudooceanicola sp.]